MPESPVVFQDLVFPAGQPTDAPYVGNSYRLTWCWRFPASGKGVFRVSDRVDVDLGYRLLEGGADNEEVYTFAFFHYAVAGVRVRF